MKYQLIFLILMCCVKRGFNTSRNPQKRGIVDSIGIAGGYPTIYGQTHNNAQCSDDTYFHCADESRCIAPEYECDNYKDCIDGSDEHSFCSYFDCGDGSYINTKYLCDDVRDCDNNHDEAKEYANCTAVTCAPDIYGKIMKVKGANVCDGVVDCMDQFNTDECNCSFTFVCNNKKCITQADVCNGEEDCGDGSDEHFCPTTTAYLSHGEQNYKLRTTAEITTETSMMSKTTQPLSHRDGPIVCTTGEHISITSICDNKNDCLNGEDEDSCFQCGNGYITPEFTVCDGVKDCPNGLDEYVCARASTKETEATTTPTKTYPNKECYYNSPTTTSYHSHITPTTVKAVKESHTEYIKQVTTTGGTMVLRFEFFTTLVLILMQILVVTLL